MKNLLSAAFLLSAATFAQAGLTTFSTSNIPAADTSNSWLNAGGTILAAVNFSTNPVRSGTFNATNPDPNVILNGVSFTPIAGVSNVSGTYFSIGNNNANPDNGRYSNVSFGTNPQLFGLIYDDIVSTGNLVNLTFTLQNLTIGQQYSLQLVFSELNTANNPTGADRSVQVASGIFTPGAFNTTGTGSDGTSDQLSYGPNAGAGLVTATFTADATTQVFTTLSNSNNLGNSRVALSGFVLSAVPEPSTCFLVISGLGAAALANRRRKIQA